MLGRTRREQCSGVFSYAIRRLEVRVELLCCGWGQVVPGDANHLLLQPLLERLSIAF